VRSSPRVHSRPGRLELQFLGLLTFWHEVFKLLDYHAPVRLRRRVRALGLGTFHAGPRTKVLCRLFASKRGCALTGITPASRRPDCTLSRPRCARADQSARAFRPTAGDPVDRGSTTPSFRTTSSHIACVCVTVAFRRSSPAACAAKVWPLASAHCAPTRLLRRSPHLTVPSLSRKRGG